MKITQISVFLENRKGRLYEICSMLGKADINIRALTIAETEAFGVLRIVVDRPADAIELFRRNSVTANQTEVVAVEIPDQPGGLARVLGILADHDVNVEYMYGFVEKFSENALLVFRFDNPEYAHQVLRQNAIKVVGERDIQGL
ncbi:MAG: ACT domain-containing protein [Planctomycetales bacterium]|nr:ACT domain-containing protein [Planctomycetales bacterium]